MNKNIIGSNIYNVKTHNLHAILMCFLYDKYLSRSQIAKKTNLSSTTITNLIAELLEQGIVSEIDANQSNNGERTVGRPRTALKLNHDARCAIGVHIGIGKYRVALVNLYAEVKSYRIESFSLENEPDNVLNKIQQTIMDMIESNHFNHQQILGIGIGASGLVNFETGVNVLAPNLGWKSIPIKSWFQETTNYPVVVDNNVRTMAVGEAFFGKGVNVDSLAFIYGRVGVGAGFVFSGKVHRGISTGAGEIGHMIMIPQGGKECRCGQSGCLETLVTEPIIIQAAQEIVASEPNGLLAKHMHDQVSLKPIQNIFAAAREGDQATMEMIKDRAHYLGIALANLVNILNPELFILGGIFSEGKDLFLPEIEKTIQQKAFAGMGYSVRIETTSFGWEAGVIGASALALTHFFYQKPDHLSNITSTNSSKEFNYPNVYQTRKL